MDTHWLHSHWCVPDSYCSRLRTVSLSHFGGGVDTVIKQNMVFYDSVNNLGIVQQSLSFARVDSTQWPTYKIVNSCNNWLDKVTGYAIGADRRFQWDDTNHTKLPIGTTNLVANQSDYSFLTDEQGNRILNLTRIEVQDSNGTWRVLTPRDMTDDMEAQDEQLRTASLPVEYDKISDNIIRLLPKPVSSVTAGLKFYFQRTPSYFAASDTTKEPGVSPLLHRGFVIASAYDIALTLGLENLQPLSVELAKEEQKMKDAFATRNTDEEVFFSSQTVNPV